MSKARWGKVGEQLTPVYNLYDVRLVVAKPRRRDPNFVSGGLRRGTIAVRWDLSTGVAQKHIWSLT